MERFYGRIRELEKLTKVFGQVKKGGARAVLVSGMAGTGKTALITRFGMEAETSGALFAYGKADTLKRNTPFSTLTVAVDMLAKKIIAENPAHKTKLKNLIRKNFGPDLEQILARTSALTYIFGSESPDVQKKKNEDNQSIKNSLLSLMEALSSLHKPLVLFLDDLQWLDEASHDFLQYLVINGLVPGLLLVMAFRSEHQYGNGRLEKTSFFFQDLQTTLSISLSGLTKRDTKGFLKQRLDTEQDLAPLAALCHNKTVGNPFYLVRLVDELLEKGVISRKNDEWVYGVSYISGLSFTENVVDLIIERLRLLEKDCLFLLKQAACIQTDISVPLLQATSRFSKEKIETLLWRPLQLDLLREVKQGFIFAHDRILESTELLLTDGEAEENHRRLAAFYLERLEEQESHIFTLLYHYGFYSHCVTDSTIKKTMSGYYFQAGEQARSQSAHTLALEHFTKGKAHFPENIWTTDYALALEFCHHIAECAYLIGDFKVADRVFAEVEREAKSFSDRIDVEMVKIPCLQAMEKQQLALDAGITILKHLGIVIPKNPSSLTVLFAVLKTWARFILTPQARLIQKRMAPGSDAYKASKCLNALGSVVYFLSPKKLLPLNTAVAFNLTLQHGYMEETPVTYIIFGLILNGMTGTVRWGRRLGNMARTISRNFHNDRLKTKELTLLSGYLDYWDKPLRENMEALQEVEEFCLRQGDNEYFSYNALYGLHCLLISYTPLHIIRLKIDKKKKVIKQINHQLTLTITCIIEQAVTNLDQGGREPWLLKGEYFDETGPDCNKKGFMKDIFYLYKFFMAFYCGRLDIASKIKKKIEQCIEIQKGTSLYIYFCFLSALVDINQKNEPKKNKSYLKILKKYASYNVAVYRGKYLLALGESLRMKGDSGATAVYQDAVTAAEKYGFLFEQALACEGLGRIAQERGDDTVCRAHFSKAIRLYRQWGLQWRQDLFEQENVKSPMCTTAKTSLKTPITDEMNHLQDFDIPLEVTVTDKVIDDSLRVMKSISGAKIIHVAVREAQSWKSCVYINDNGINRPATFVSIPEKMLAFAGATGEVIQADENSNEENYFDTAYFWNHRPSSFMVIPGKAQNGIYLEDLNSVHDMARLIELAEKILASFGSNTVLNDSDTTDKQQHRERCRIVQDYMMQQKAYQNPSLSLARLAADNSLSQRAITDAINISLGQNIRTFINSYRVEAVKLALEDQANKDKPLLEIAYSQGFNSKTTFNTVFKEHTGVTPSQFRTTHQNKSTEVHSGRERVMQL
jgi:predicted ATPase/AraC-like DNA-binding protein